jgi:hypothetical protein
MADAYRDLIAWRKATDLALEIYRATQKFPKDELYWPYLPNATSSRIGCQQYRRRQTTLLPQGICAVPVVLGVPCSNSKPNCS